MNALRTLFHEGAEYVLPGAALMALFLLVAARSERRSILRSAAGFLAAILGFLLAQILSAREFTQAAEHLRRASILVEGISLVSLSSVAVFQVILPKCHAPQPRIFQDVSFAVAIMAWFLFCLSRSGVDINGLIATSAVMSAVVAFSFQDTLGNILGGMVIQFDRSIEVGDWIKVDDVIGRITDIRWRYTAIETRNWETVLVPNSALTKSKLVVLGRREGQPLQWRRTVNFNVAVQHPPVAVIQAVQKALRAAEIPNIARDPPPDCIQTDFFNGEGRYAVRYWLLNLAADDPTDSEVRTRIFYALQRASIPIATPHTGVVLTQDTAEARAARNEHELAHRVNALHRVDMFCNLTPEETRKLAERLVPAPFRGGDIITRQGAEAHWLYLIVQGRADVVVAAPSGQSSRVAELGPGNFFGEMSLLTGEPRSATIIARTDVECFRLDKESFQDIITARPAMAEELSRLAAAYRTSLNTTLENLSAEERARRLALEHDSILNKIRRLFSLAA